MKHTGHGVNRRDFLKAGTAAAGTLAVGTYLPPRVGGGTAQGIGVRGLLRRLARRVRLPRVHQGERHRDRVGEPAGRHGVVHQHRHRGQGGRSAPYRRHDDRRAGTAQVPPCVPVPRRIAPAAPLERARHHGAPRRQRRAHRRPRAGLVPDPGHEYRGVPGRALVVARPLDAQVRGLSRHPGGTGVELRARSHRQLLVRRPGDAQRSRRPHDRAREARRAQAQRQALVPGRGPVPVAVAAGRDPRRHVLPRCHAARDRGTAFRCARPSPRRAGSSTSAPGGW